MTMYWESCRIKTVTKLYTSCGLNWTRASTSADCSRLCGSDMWPSTYCL